MPSPSIARLQLILSALLWSTNGVLLKSLPGVHWLAIAGVRSLFACLLFLPGLRLARPPARLLVPAVLLYAVVVSALMGSMQLGTAAQGIWLQYIAPALVALWTWLVLRQRLRPAETFAALLTGLAVGLIVTGGEGRAHQQSLLLGISSGVAFAAFILVLKAIGPTSPSAIHLWTNLGAAALLLPAALALRVPLPGVPREIALLAGMGVGQLALAYHFFQRGLAQTRAVEAAIIILLEPILNPIWVYLFIGEIPSPRVIAGCVLIACALISFAITAAPGNRAPREPGRPKV